MQECRRTEQTCLFIHYPVFDKHTIIYITEFVILFLITLEIKGQETMSVQRRDEVQSLSSIECPNKTVTDSRINRRKNKTETVA